MGPTMAHLTDTWGDASRSARTGLFVGSRTRGLATSSRYTKVARLGGFDLVLVCATLATAAMGALMVYSATRYELLASGMSPHYWLKRDVLFLSIGMVAMVAMALVDYHRWEAMWGAIAGGTLLLLVAVMVPHVGKNALGSTRWLPLGPFQLQPSTFADLAMIVVVAALLSRGESPPSTARLVGVVAIVAVTMAIVAKQPDLGSAIVIGVVLAAMLVVGGTRARHLLLLALAGLAAVFAVIHFGMLHGYQASRLTGFLHQNQQTSGSNYNLAQSKIDIGGGGIFGHGLFRDSQTNLQYVPEQQTDFIFTAVGGQLGFFGTSTVLLLYAVIASRLWKAARNAPDRAGMLMATGVFTLLIFSVFENAGMTIGLTPITGIPLPLMSYGGSADLVFMSAIGLALNVARQRSSRPAAQAGSSAL